MKKSSGAAGTTKKATGAKAGAARSTKRGAKATAAPGASDVERSIAARVERLRAALGEPFDEDPRLGHYRTALLDTDQAMRARPEPRPPKADFFARADAFLAAHEVALAAPASSTKESAWAELCERAAMRFNVESIARGHVRTASAVKSLEQEFFTQWNELPHRETKGFWAAVAKAGLPYARRDLLGEIFERGRITSREHYEHAVDMVGTAVDEGLLSAKQVEQLKKLIGGYESARGR